MEVILTSNARRRGVSRLMGGPQGMPDTDWISASSRRWRRGLAGANRRRLAQPFGSDCETPGLRLHRKCYLSSRFKVSPMLPVAHGRTRRKWRRWTSTPRFQRSCVTLCASAHEALLQKRAL